jgi:hypothetical protein
MLACACSTSAQKAPGYLGQRFLVGYRHILTPAAQNLNGRGNRGFNHLNMIEFEYVTGRHTSLGIVIGRAKTHFNFDQYNVNYLQVLNTNGYGTYFSTEDRVNAVWITGINLKLQIAQLSPVGVYFGLETGILSTKFDAAFTNTNVVTGQYSLEERYDLQLNAEQAYRMPYGKLSFGGRLQLSDKIGWGWNAGIASPLVPRYWLLLSGTHSPQQTEEYISTTVFQRYEALIDIQVGVSVHYLF